MDKRMAIQFFLNNFLGLQDVEMVTHLEKVAIVLDKNKKDFLFFEGDKGDIIYFVISGVVKLFKTNKEGKEAVIHFVNPGEIFAEILFMMEFKYPVSAIMLEKGTVLGISAKELFKLVKTNPDFAVKFIGAMTKRLKYFVNLVENLRLSDVRQRFLHYLKTLQEKKGNCFVLPVPKGEIAALLGTTKETFSRLLKQLQEEGVLTVKGKTITLHKEL